LITSTLSMSSDSRSAVEPLAPASDEVASGSDDCVRMTPSTTMSGALALLMLVGVRRTTLVPPPGRPLGTTVTPAIFP
jgi:hypothetical protein